MNADSGHARDEVIKSLEKLFSKILDSFRELDSNIEKIKDGEFEKTIAVIAFSSSVHDGVMEFFNHVEEADRVLCRMNSLARHAQTSLSANSV